MNSEKIAICVAGLGVGMKHARAYSEMEDVELYLCDTDDNRLKEGARRLRVAGTFSAIHQAVEHPRLDAIDICLPNSFHSKLAIEALGHKKHCMVEKPLATSLNEADLMKEAASNSGALLAVAENFQFSPLNLGTAEIVESGVLGKPLFAIVKYEMWPSSFSRSSWWLDRELAGGGVLLCAGVHAVRTIRMLIKSEAKRVNAVAGTPILGIASEDSCLVTIEFEDGTLGSLPTSWVTPQSSTVIEVFGSRGSLVGGRDGAITTRVETGAAWRDEHKFVEDVDTITNECATFVQSIRSGSVDERISFENGRKDLEVVEAAYRSMETKQGVELPLSFPG